MSRSDQKEDGYVVVWITAPNEAEAKGLARCILDRRLGACVNLVRGVTSLFWWEGRVDEADEVLLMVKTRKDRLTRLITEVKARHSYDVPEIIALPILRGQPDYLRWIDEVVGE